MQPALAAAGENAGSDGRFCWLKLKQFVVVFSCSGELSDHSIDQPMRNHLNHLAHGTADTPQSLGHSGKRTQSTFGNASE